MKERKSPIVRRLTAGLLLGTCLSPAGASAQTWIGGTGTNFATDANWSTGTSPDGTQTGTFGATSNTSVTMTTALASVGGIQFSAAASAYTFDVNLGGSSMGVGGITNLSANIQALAVTNVVNFSVSAGTSDNIAFTLDHSLLRYAGTASLGNSTVAMTNGSTLFLQGNASGGTAAVTSTGGSIGIGLLSSAGTTLGSISGSANIALSSKTLTVGGNNQTTSFSGMIFASGGSLVKEGTGTLTLDGVNSQTGGTTINGGALSVSADNNIGDAAGALAFGGGTLQLGAAFDLAGTRTVTLNSGGGTIDTNGFDTTVSQSIGGSGGLTKTGSGTLILSANNAYTGGTTLAGGSLDISTGNALATTGALAISSGTFNMNDNNQTVAGFSATGGAVGLGSGTLTAGDSSDTTVAAQLISGTGGALVKQGSGTMTLTAVNTYDGGTTINAGALSVSADDNLGSSAGGVTLNGGALRFGAAFNLSGARSVTIDSGGGTIDTNGFDTTMSLNIGGTGALTKTGTGTLTLTGTSGYAGGTTVSGGVLAGTTASLQGNITNDATVVFNQAGAGSYGGDMSGSGGLTKRGAGTLTLNGTNSQLGTTRIEGGALSVGSDTNLGGANASLFLDGGTLRTTGTFTSNRLVGLLGGGGTFDITTGTVTFSGSVEDVLTPGSLTKTGAGTLVLAGSASHTGGTTISTGTLQIGDGSTTGSITGNVVNDGVLAFNRGDGITFAGDISGSGAVRQNGVGSLRLTGNNTYAGGTTVDTGFLTVSSDANLGIAAGGLTLVNGGVLELAGGSFTTNRTVTLGAGGGGIFFINQNRTLGLGGAITGSEALIKAGSGRLDITGNNTGFSGPTGIANGILAIDNANALGSGTVQISQTGTLLGTATFTLTNTLAVAAGDVGTVAATTGTTLTLAPASIAAAGAELVLGSTTNTGTVVVAPGSATSAGLNFLVIAGGTVQAGNANFSALTSSGTTVIDSGATLGLAGFDTTMAALQGGGTLATGTTVGQVTTIGAGSFGGAITGAGGVNKTGTGTLILAGTNSYTGGTTVSDGTLQLGSATAFVANTALTVNGGTFDNGGNAVTVGALSGSGGGILLSGGSLTTNSVANATLAANISGTGGFTKAGAGTLILTGANSYAGGTTVSGGILQGNSASLQGNILNNASVVFNQTGSGTYAGNMSGSGGMTLQGGGVLAMTGTNTYSGATTVNASTLVVNGSLASAVTLTNGGILGGNGSIGTLVSNGGTVAPGNSIGTLNINGNFTQNGGIYVVEANGQGQSDRINATGTATISGGATVQVVAAAGNYATSTTYTILNATGGVSGTYSGVTSNFAFLTPSLTYDPNNVFLTLALQGNAFSGFGGNTNNQRAVGAALDQSYANATGDFATVIGALANLSTAQAGPTLNTISGQPWADFGTTNVANAALFMNTLGQQMANARSGTARVALAQACEAEACDEARPLSAWFSGLGGLGSVQGNGNSSTLTYNVGGGAAGLDWRFDPRFLVGLGVGYAHGTQWVNSFMGQGWSDSVSVAAYGSFTPMGQGAGFYADALAGYAYLNNQMQRPIQIPGLQQRTASGSTGANQFLAQVETGYRFGVWEMAGATPFARFQTSSTTQNAFAESGANTLNLAVAQQTTTSLRTMLGAAFDTSLPLDSERALGLNIRFGWQHEYADTARPITAAFAGAPSASFTVYGATPTRDSAIVGFAATTNVAAATQLYLRYDGELAAGTDNHALTAGLRMSW